MGDIILDLDSFNPSYDDHECVDDYLTPLAACVLAELAEERPGPFVVLEDCEETLLMHRAYELVIDVINSMFALHHAMRTDCDAIFREKLAEHVAIGDELIINLTNIKSFESRCALEAWRILQRKNCVQLVENMRTMHGIILGKVIERDASAWPIENSAAFWQLLSPRN